MFFYIQLNIHLFFEQIKKIWWEAMAPVASHIYTYAVPRRGLRLTTAIAADGKRYNSGPDSDMSEPDSVNSQVRRL